MSERIVDKCDEKTLTSNVSIKWTDTGLQLGHRWRTVSCVLWPKATKMRDPATLFILLLRPRPIYLYLPLAAATAAADLTTPPAPSRDSVLHAGYQRFHKLQEWIITLCSHWRVRKAFSFLLDIRRELTEIVRMACVSGRLSESENIMHKD